MAVLVLALVLATGLCLYLMCLVHRRRTRAGKHDPLLAAKREEKKDKKEREKRT